jgi:hypothetical protein
MTSLTRIARPFGLDPRAEIFAKPPGEHGRGERTGSAANTSFAPSPQPSSDNPTVDTPLNHLLEQERVLSLERRRLHRRIEFVGGTAAHEPAAKELLASLIAEEKELSRKRRELHALIDRVKAGSSSPSSDSE